MSILKTVKLVALAIAVIAVALLAADLTIMGFSLLSLLLGTAAGIFIAVRIINE